MPRYLLSLLGLVLITGAVLTGCDRPAPSAPSADVPAPSVPLATAVPFTDVELRRIRTLSPLPPVPPDPTNRWADDPDAAAFGQTLFFDPRLSANGQIACASCHDPTKGFGDAVPLGGGLATMDRHTMSLWNVGYNRWFFWDGRADTLWGQALDPIEEPREHGFTRAGVARVLHDDPDLRTTYERVFGPMPPLEDAGRFPAAARPVPDDPAHPHARAWSAMTSEDRHAIDVVFANAGKAIAAYERRLVSRRAPFDVFVEGLVSGDREKLSALGADAQRGLKLFVGAANCRMCHFGPNFTDGEFHSTGVPPREGGRPRDSGRYDGIAHVQTTDFAAAGPHSDAGDDARALAADKVDALVRTSESWGQFKTPSLRNVALTAPYMHQGQYQTLRDVLDHYNTLADAELPSHHQEQLLVPLGLSDADLADLEAFLRSLTDEAIAPALRTAP